MELDYKKHENVLVVYLHGRFDIVFTQIIEKEIFKLISDDTASHLIFNLKGVEYVSSATLRLFISITRLFKERRKRFVICNINGSVKKILDIVELRSILHVLKTEEDALEFILNEDILHSL